MVNLWDIFKKVKEILSDVNSMVWHLKDIYDAVPWTWWYTESGFRTLLKAFYYPDWKLPDVFESVMDGITREVKWKVDWLWDKLDEVPDDITSISGDVSDLLNRVEELPGDISDAKDVLTDKVEGQIDWLNGKLQDTKTALSGDISSLGDDVDGWFDEQWKNIDEGLGDVQDNINSSLSDTGSWLQSQMDKAHKATRTAFSQALGSMQSQVGGAIGALWDNLKSAVKVIDPSKWVSDLQSQLQSYRERLENILAPGSPLSPEEAKSKGEEVYKLGNILMGLLSVMKVTAEASSSGLLDMTLRSINDIPIIKELSNIVDEITRVRMDAGLTQAYEYYVQSQHTPKIPGKSDLTHYLVREALAGGSASERVKNYKKWMNYLGYSDKWAEIEWDSHWELPSWFRVRDALRRGVIDEKEFKKFMRYLDYRPDARDWQTQSDQELMVKLAYRTWGIRDIRRAWELGVIDDGEMKERLQNRGYDPDEIEKITKVQQNIAFRAEINDRVREDRDAVRDGYMSTEQFRANMEALGMAPWKRDYKVAYAKKRRRAEYYETMIDTIKDAYTEGAFGEGRLINLLKRFVVSEKALAMHVTEAYVKKIGEWPEPEDIGGIKPIQVS